MKIFKDTGKVNQSANFGWQNQDLALLGLREGYKKSADQLVDIAIESHGNLKILDTYIFPILFSYRHSIELSLKHIYLRAKGKLPDGGHDLLILWDNVKREIIDGMLCSSDFFEMVRMFKSDFHEYPIGDIKLDTVRAMIKELQEANQNPGEVAPNQRQIDQNAEVWRYLINTDDNLFFTCSHAIDYLVLKNGIDYLYDVLDRIYFIINEYLSS